MSNSNRGGKGGGRSGPGNWPSTTGNPSGKGCGNNPPSASGGHLSGIPVIPSSMPSPAERRELERKALRSRFEGDRIEAIEQRYDSRVLRDIANSDRGNTSQAARRRLSNLDNDDD